MAAGALEACAVLLLSLSLSLFLCLPYLWFPALDLSGLRGGVSVFVGEGVRVCVCVCVSLCVCVCVRECVVRPRLRETARLPARVRLGVGLGPRPRPELPEDCQGSPRQRPPRLRPRSSSGFLDAESRGAGGPRGGNPGLQRESGAPATRPERGWKAGGGSERGGVPGASGRCGLRCGWGRGLKERGGREKQKQQKAYSTRYSQAVSHPSTNRARPCLASEIRRDRARSGWYGRRRRRLPPGALRALRCACLSL